MEKVSNKYLVPLICLALAITTIAVFYQVYEYGFVDIDDPHYVSANRHVKAGLTIDSITWAFRAAYAGNWHPLTWLSHMLDCQLFGTDPGWHHLTNLLLHILNALLVFAVFNRMTKAVWRSAFVAAAFALHPLHVESVAWIAERKDVLSTLFWMLTIAAYLRYVERPNSTRYLLTLLVFALGLMAKPMLVTLPFVLLLLDYWPLGRVQLEEPAGKDNKQPKKRASAGFQWQVCYRLVREKFPFFVLSGVLCVITVLVQRGGGAVMSVKMFPLTFRIANVFVSYVTYIAKMIWPAHLAVFYFSPELSLWMAVASAVFLLIISRRVIDHARSHKYLLTGWLWYIGTLVPVIGLVQVGDQSHADRYTYIPLTGLFVMVAWGLPDLLRKWRYRKIITGVSAIAVLSALAVNTRVQQSYWRNSQTLFEHTLKVTKENYKAHFCLGIYQLKQGNFDDAVVHFKETLRIMPDNPEALNNLGIVFFRKGELDEAFTHYTEAVRIKPDFPEAHRNLGVLFVQEGKLDEAISEFEEALRIRPDYQDAQISLNAVRANKERAP